MEGEKPRTNMCTSLAATGERERETAREASRDRQRETRVKHHEQRSDHKRGRVEEYQRREEIAVRERVSRTD